MNALLLTVLAFSGANGYTNVGGGEPHGYSGGASGGAFTGYCDECEAGGRHHGHHGHGGLLHGYCGPMPQSCYNPSFGCYPSTRYMHRYPAFHNYYYRSAYNYRHYSDYPWHAGLHEPTSMFSHHVPSETAPQAIPAPLPSASLSAPANPIRSARIDGTPTPAAHR